MYLEQRELEVLKKGLGELGIDVSNTVIDKFRTYIKILYDYKHRLHLLSHKDYNRISLKHFLPSLMILKYLSYEKNACDIGAGAGFPSIPVKILKPEINFTLFESVKKKAHFLEVLIQELELSGIKVEPTRAENYEGEKFDLILIRAAGKVKDLVRTIDRLILPQGRAIFYKSAAVETEIRQAEENLFKLNFAYSIERVTTPIKKIPMALIFLNKKWYQ